MNLRHGQQEKGDQHEKNHAEHAAVGQVIESQKGAKSANEVHEAGYDGPSSLPGATRFFLPKSAASGTFHIL